MDTRSLPNSKEVEKAVLGAFIRDPQEVGGTLAERGVTAEHFWQSGRAALFGVLMTLWSEGKDTDLSSVVERLEAGALLESVGGMAELAELAQYPTAALIGQHVDALDEKLRRRQRIRLCWEAAEKNFDPLEDGAALQAELEQAVLSIGERQSGDEQPFKTHLCGALNRLQTRCETKSGLVGLSTGLRGLDELTGGLADSELIIVSAETSGGKTALAMRFLESVTVAANLPAALFSFEMSNEEVTDRLLASNALVDLHSFRKGTLTEGDMNRVAGGCQRMAHARIFLRDQSDLNVMQVRAIARRLKRRHGIRLVIVDYAQLIPPIAGTKGENREQEVAKISRNLKAMAKELVLPVVALSQLNEDGKVRESRAISHDANLLIIIQEDEGRHWLKIAKQRNGPRDRVPVTFRKPYTRFDDYAGEDRVEAKPEKRSWFK